MPTFDPDAAAQFDGLFGLPFAEDEARCVLVPVPFDATTSYRPGAANGPRAILEASRQVDLWDLEYGRVYEPGIHLVGERAEVRAWSDEARARAEEVIAHGGEVQGDAKLEASLAFVNERSVRMNERVHADSAARLASGKIVGVIGGDHSTPFGLIRAASERWPGLGVLHVDAHADLRDAYEGFAFSHASIMHNVATRLPGVGPLVQVGIRDCCETEVRFIRESHGRIETHFDLTLARERARGTTWHSQVERVVESLPEFVHVSFDIDGLDPTLCPHTGTPVPGGLSFHDATLLFLVLAKSGRKIVSFDVNEVAPGADGDEWDGNVGARLLYKLIGAAFLSHGLLKLE